MRSWRRGWRSNRGAVRPNLRSSRRVIPAHAGFQSPGDPSLLYTNGTPNQGVTFRARPLDSLHAAPTIAGARGSGSLIVGGPESATPEPSMRRTLQRLKSRGTLWLAARALAGAVAAAMIVSPGTRLSAQDLAPKLPSQAGSGQETCERAAPTLLEGAVIRREPRPVPGRAWNAHSRPSTAMRDRLPVRSAPSARPSPHRWLLNEIGVPLRI